MKKAYKAPEIEVVEIDMRVECGGVSITAMPDSALPVNSDEWNGSF